MINQTIVCSVAGLDGFEFWQTSRDGLTAWTGGLGLLANDNLQASADIHRRPSFRLNFRDCES